MLFGLLATGFVVLALLLILFVMLQKGKGSLGLYTGGSAQMLFGGSGGQELFQKITWILLAIFMVGSLGLSLLKSRSSKPSLAQRGSQASRH